MENNSYINKINILRMRHPTVIQSVHLSKIIFWNFIADKHVT